MASPPREPSVKAAVIATEPFLTRAVEGLPKQAMEEYPDRTLAVPGADPHEVAPETTFAAASTEDRMSCIAVVRDGAPLAIV